MQTFDGQVAVVTGGTGALGRRIALLFAAEGARVAVPYRHAEDAQALRTDLGGGDDVLWAEQADATDGAGMAGFIDGVAEHFGRLDLLINAIGGFTGGRPLHETDTATWDHLLAINLRAVYLACHAAVPYLLQQGRGAIVNVSSRPALIVTPNVAAYAVAKAGVLTLTSTLAEELKPHRITVNAVVAGTIDTASNRAVAAPESVSHFTGPDDIARVICWLCSDAAAIISGAAIPVYGMS